MRQIRESILNLPGYEKNPKSHEHNDDHPVDTQPLCPATQEARRHDESENGSAEHDGGGVAQWDQLDCHKHASQEPSPQQPLGHGATPNTGFIFMQQLRGFLDQLCHLEICFLSTL